MKLPRSTKKHSVSAAVAQSVVVGFVDEAPKSNKAKIKLKATARAAKVTRPSSRRAAKPKKAPTIVPLKADSSSTPSPLANHGPRAKFSFKRHVLPPFLGIVAMVGVLGVLNGQYLMAQYRYRYDHKTIAQVSTTPASTTTGTSSSSNTINAYASPNPERGPYLTIPSIGVEAPIVFEPSFAEWKVQLALREGVDHYGTTANPGQNGNMVILGHSSGQPWAPGKYKFIFTLLDKVQKDQAIVVDYKGTRYTYKVTSIVVVAPTNGAVLAATDKPMLTLITCTPVGTSKNRLVVKAELVSPLPAAGSGVTSNTSDGTPLPQLLPGS